MKSNTKKRLIAFMLCMVLVLSSTISAFADEPQNTDSQSQAEVVTEPTADEPQNTDSQSQAEVVTEPAADEATEDTTTEDVSTENTISALPSTGGIGTTIFTIAGCVIMIAAAGLFFASRKKSDNK